MSDVFLERTFEPVITARDVGDMARTSASCFDLYRVVWRGSCLSSDGQRMLCWFSAPDAESARQALRREKVDLRLVWPGTVHDAAGVDDARAATANVLVERSFAEPVLLESIQAIEDEAIGCLNAHRVEFLRTFFARDRRRMICLYRAPDAESVRIAQRQAGMPVDRVWAFRRVGPELLQG
jgi:hypothetical protein